MPIQTQIFFDLKEPSKLLSKKEQTRSKKLDDINHRMKIGRYCNMRGEIWIRGNYCKDFENICKYISIYISYSVLLH